MAQPQEHVAIAQELLLAKSLMDWRRDPDVSFRRIIRSNCSRFFTYDQQIDPRDILRLSINSTLSNLARQIFLSNYEYLRHNIDDKMSNKLKQLKTETSNTKNNLNTSKFLDVLRQAIAHNDLSNETPCWHLTENSNIEINFKGNSFTFTVEQFLLVLNEFLSLKKEHFYGRLQIEHRDLDSAMRRQKLKPSNISKFITQFDANDLHTPYDNYQVVSLYNLLTSKTDATSEELLELIAENDFFILQRLLPLKHNAGNISYINNMIFRALPWLNSNYLKRDDFLYSALLFEKNVNLIDNTTTKPIARCNLFSFISNETMILEDTLTANALFTLFSICKTSDIEKYFDGIDANRLRNSLMHGRYFYDHNNSFEFYDGRDNNNLEHVATLNLNQILAAISNFMKDTLNNNTSHSI